MRLENKLDCNESQSLMAAYIDGELDSANAIQYRLHLETCAECTGAYRELHDLHTTIKTHGTNHVAPSYLRHRIQAALPRPSRRSLKFANLPWAWINFGVAITCTLAFAVMCSLYLSVPSLQDRIEDEIVASHTRSLMAAHLSDVISTDQHTVKPWFSGKLDFSPTVYDFAQQEFPLVGGRLDYVDHRAVAALAYRHRLHVLNLFVWPEPSQKGAAQLAVSKQGYQLIHWTQSGMCYWLISDMNAQDLNEFKHLLVARIEKENMH